MDIDLPQHIGQRRHGGKVLRKRKRNRQDSNLKAQELARTNRDDFEEESSGSESDEWYDGDEHDAYAFEEGGYYKARPGDLLNRRYVVKKRMGWGHFSQVYICWDRQNEIYVAMKIQKTGEDYITSGEEEAEFHTAINKIEVEDSKVCRMVESFAVYSNRGKHIAMVFELMSSCLFELQEYDEDEPGLPLGVVKAVIREVLMGVSELHRAGLIHTDLKPENCMLEYFKDIDEDEFAMYRMMYDFKASQADLEAKKDKLENEPLNKNQRKRLRKSVQKLENKVQENLHLITQDTADDAKQTLKEGLIHMGKSVIATGHARTKLVDLGTACWIEEGPEYEIGTRNYRAPECIMGMRFTEAIDIWAIACMTVELIHGELLFDPDMEDEDDTFDNEMRNAVHLKQIIQALGRLPKSLQSRDYFNRKGELLKVGEFELGDIQDVIREKCPGLDEDDTRELVEFLLPMFELDPTKRATAVQCLENGWLELSNVDRDDIRQWIEDLECLQSSDEDMEDMEEEELQGMDT